MLRKGEDGVELIIVHDNGVKGQKGFTEEEIQSMEEIQSIIDAYKNLGITVYDYFTEW